MSMWCEKCNKVNYSKGKCDHCGYIPKDTSKTYTVRENKGVKVTRGITKNVKAYMVPCTVCGNDIAVKATSCPHCGDIKSKNLFWKIIKIIFIVVIVLFLIEIVLASIGIVFFDDILKVMQKEQKVTIDKTFKQLNKQLNQTLKIQPIKMNTPNVYQQNLKEKDRKRQILIQSKERELQRLKIESENAKLRLKREMIK